MTRGARTREETTERTNGKWERRARSEGKLRVREVQREDVGSSMEENAGDCDGGCGHVPSHFPACHLPFFFSPVFPLFDPRRIRSYVYEYSHSEALFIIDISHIMV